MVMSYRPVEVDGVVLDPRRAAHRLTLSELKAGAIRMRNFGASLSTIADKLGMNEDDAEHVLAEGLRELIADDVETVRARQQAVLNDVRKAMYPSMLEGDDKAAGTIIKVLSHEADLHGLKAAQRVHVGLDQETFTTTVDEDIRALGYHPRNDVVIEDSDSDDGWSNT